MTYILVWCSQMGVFGLEGPDCQRQSYTEPELRERFKADPILTQWLEFTRAHPDTEVVYDMLPL